MVHVLSAVLRKVRNSLRRDGTLLIFQPSQDNPVIAVEINGKVVFQEETNEQNFRGYLGATAQAIRQSVEKGRFEIVRETIVPEGDSYLCDEFESLDEWEEARLSFCEDLEMFTEMSERIRKIVEGRIHSVSEYWRQHQIILRACSREEER